MVVFINKITIIEDSNQKVGKHDAVNEYFEKNGIEVVRQRLPVGDYVLMTDKAKDVFDRKASRGIPVKMMDLLGTYDIAIDEKFSIQELVGDICGKAHERFRDECILAANNGIRLVVLVRNDREIVYNKNGKLIVNDTITDLKDLHKWVNPRLWIFQSGKQKYPRATKGITLEKACYSMEKKYGVKFMFCSSTDAGAKIVKLLTQGDCKK